MTISAKNANTPDHDAIVRVVQRYVDAYNEGDVAKFKEVFHESGWIFYTDVGGALHQALLSDCFEAWTAPHKHQVVGRFISVIQAGDVAVVTLGFDNSEGRSMSWVDIHSLLRIGGVWKIMNKTATHNRRAAWAGDGYLHRRGTPPRTTKRRRG
jgi:ketosteroid isomerase-like protein